MNILYIGPERNKGIIAGIAKRFYAEERKIKHHVEGLSGLDGVDALVLVGRPEPVFSNERVYLKFMKRAAAQGKVVAIALDELDLPYDNKYIGWRINFNPRLSNPLSNAVVIPLEIYLRQI
ncbi:MAG TPA: hypothetical protein VJJ21_00940 [Candidatus Nanoarchaeia archaeon]|nr:hypothetical protein [Candidatus Nanoarchaeia archaeon]